MLKEKILLKLERLEFYCSQFSSFLPNSMGTYVNSLKDQMAIERLFQVSIELMIDVGFLLLKYLHLGVPADEENIFDLLNENLKNAATYKNMKRFRNLLVHQYEKINNEIVFKYASEKITDFNTFISDVRKIIKRL